MLNSIVLFIDKPLLSLNISEHILALRQRYKVREHLRILVIKVTELRESDNSLLILDVESLQELINVVEDEIVFEYADNVSLLIVDQVIDHLQILKLFVHALIFPTKILLD